MTIPKFLQIHTLHSYPAALLNRDDSGLAKRMPFGGAVRTRISSQCLKRHWRMAEDEFSLRNIEGFTDSIRSRNAVTLGVVKPLEDSQAASREVLNAIKEVFQEKVYSGSGTQPLLLGLPEVEYLREKASIICSEHPNDDKSAREAADLLFSTQRRNEERDNFRSFREQTKFPGGLISALFGRMVTSDTAANIEAAIHVAHAFTVHEVETEMDFWAAIDDLPLESEGAGAAHLNDMELTAGLFYGYVVVDVPGLVSNLDGCQPEDWQAADRELASRVVHNLIHLIATVTPGAKLGSTAPYACADLVLVEAGSRQPRSLANAFRYPQPPLYDKAVNRLADYMSETDEMYGVHTVRRAAVRHKHPLPDAKLVNMDDLATWAAEAVHSSKAV